MEPAFENVIGQTSVGDCRRACSVVANAEFARAHSLLDISNAVMGEVLYVNKLKTVAFTKVYSETFCAVS